MNEINRRILADGLAWLYDTAQPDGALVTHHGVTVTGEGNRLFGFVPSGYAARPVVVVIVAKPEWGNPLADEGPVNPLEPGELEALAAEVAAAGWEVASSWNGHPGLTGSLGLAEPAHPSLLAAVEQYGAGCREHPAKHVFCECGWSRPGGELLIEPGGAAEVAA